MGLLDPSLIQGLGFLFNKRLTVQANTPTRDDAGQPIEGWADLADHVDIPAVVSPVPAGKSPEMRRPDGTIVVAPFKALLQGHFPAIREAMRAVVAGQAYNITLVQHDSQDLTTTLFLEVVS